MKDKGWVILLIVGFCLGMILIWVDSDMQIEAENLANEMCKAQGYETYVTFSRKSFSNKPYGVVCGTLKERLIAEGKVKAYDIDNATIILGR